MTYFQAPNSVVAIKAIAKKNLAKSQNLLGKEIKILKVSKGETFIAFLHGFSAQLITKVVFSSF